ncbi:MAG: HAD-IC family P-type ATPase [Chloroflexota bacterium]|nr:HAD-IC family P-type ATPase [Dehalococcoidia bacterium]MDW8255151.1 HAD-IC family P-type ATPase [Chloroflexota bacterium]
MAERSAIAQDYPAADWHALPSEAVAELLSTSEHGLSPESVAARLARYGPNQLPEAPPPSDLELILHQFRSPLVLILMAAGVATIVLGKYVDTAVIAAVLVINATVGFIQERRAERAARALMRLLTPHARVVRNGQERDIESVDLVPGDVVLLESGMRVPADLRLTSTTALQIDESLLTGESIPVAKQAGVLAAEVPATDRTNLAYLGTIVVSGRGRGYVVATGERTQLGAIAASLRDTGTTANPLEIRLKRFSRVIGIAVGIAAAIAFVIGVLLGESPTDMFLVAVALAVASIPEGLPIAFTITLALGVQRMARRNAIIRRLPAVETLGSTTVIGSDKTGTLTENRMTVQQIWANGRHFQVAAGENLTGELLADGIPTPLVEQPTVAQLLITAILTNEAEVYRTHDGFATQGDPTEAALLVAAARLGLEPEQVRDRYDLLTDLPFEPERQYSASVRLHDGAAWLFVKGAPERILAMCDAQARDDGLAPLDLGEVHAALDAMAADGLRVLGFASVRLPHPPPTEMPLPELRGLHFLGLAGMMDPPRPGVREAIANCRDAGIRVIMITGDHAVTARAIGAQLGLAGRDALVVTGTQLAAMSDAELDEVVRRASIFARVSPDQKLRIVQALRRRGEVVAVTGDGVNDAPALRAADIGIAMGKSGTDVAREASSMILADDNFVSIVAAVEEGRITFDNLRNVTFFLVSTGAATVLAILTALTLRWPIPFLPTQLIWLNVVTNGLQDVALAFEPGERGVLRRRPRPRTEGLLSRTLWERTIVAGIVMGIGTLAMFWWELNQSGSLTQAQTVALTTMVIFQMFQVGNSRSERLSVFQKSPFSNPFLFIATTAALLIHIAALYFPPTQFVLRVEPISLDAWLRIIPVAATIIVAMEIHKLIRRPRPDRPGSGGRRFVPAAVGSPGPAQTG